MKIEIFFDIVCPWCYIGKKRMERALAQRPDVSIEKRWRAFELNPGMPPSGMERSFYTQAKFGSRERAKRLYDTIALIGSQEGILFAFDQIKRTPSTLTAHALLKASWGIGKGEELLEALFKAYFTEGLDIGDVSVLKDIAIQNKVNPDILDALDPYYDEVQKDLKFRTYIGGVPHYVFDSKYALAGAQEPEILLRLLDLSYIAERMQSTP